MNSIHPSRAHARPLALLLSLPVMFAAAACEKAPPEPETKKESAPVAPPSAASGAELHSGLSPAAPSAGDPFDGKFTLADATKDIPGAGALIATIDTSEGALKCKLLEDRAPITVANFVGLAQGTRPWKDTSGWVTKPAYDGTTFHRIIKGFMIQGGDAKGNGSGEPGYVIPDELWSGAKHDRAGLLCMANRGPNTNGAQFFITDDAAPHLDRSYTIFGECLPVDTVHKIASVKVRGESPEQTVRINSVKVAHEKGGSGAGASAGAKSGGDAGAKH